MTDSQIFFVGVFTTFLCTLFLATTVYEIRKTATDYERDREKTATQ